jgi:hypothetical protein
MKKKELNDLISDLILRVFPLVADLEQRVARLETLDQDLAVDVRMLKAGHGLPVGPGPASDGLHPWPRERFPEGGGHDDQ